MGALSAPEGVSRAHADIGTGERLPLHHARRCMAREQGMNSSEVASGVAVTPCAAGSDERQPWS